MSPPLVVAYALAGRVDKDLTTEPVGQGKNGPVFLKDIWPTLQEVRDAMQAALKPEVFRKLYSDFASQNPKWNEIPSSVGNVYEWDRNSTYIQEPPFFVDIHRVEPPDDRGDPGRPGRSASSATRSPPTTSPPPARSRRPPRRVASSSRTASRRPISTATAAGAATTAS